MDRLISGSPTGLRQVATGIKAGKFYLQTTGTILALATATSANIDWDSTPSLPMEDTAVFIDAGGSITDILLPESGIWLLTVNLKWEFAAVPSGKITSTINYSSGGIPVAQGFASQICNTTDTFHQSVASMQYCGNGGEYLYVRCDNDAGQDVDITAILGVTLVG